MKIKKIQNVLTIIVVAFVSSGFISCGKDDPENEIKSEAVQIVGWWDTMPHSQGKFDSYAFWENGTGIYCQFTENSSTSSSCHYTILFTYTYTEDVLTLDYGFDYIQKFRITQISDNYLNMKNGYKSISCSKVKDGLSSFSNMIPDYSMSIIDTWDILDTEKSQRFIVTCRADGTYESKGYSKDTKTYPDINEEGTYEVDNSRVRFCSDNTESLLDGRIFLVTWAGNVLSLQTENGMAITLNPAGLSFGCFK